MKRILVNLTYYNKRLMYVFYSGVICFATILVSGCEKIEEKENSHIPEQKVNEKNIAPYIQSLNLKINKIQSTSKEEEKSKNISELAFLYIEGSHGVKRSFSEAIEMIEQGLEHDQKLLEDILLRHINLNNRTQEEAMDYAGYDILQFNSYSLAAYLSLQYPEETKNSAKINSAANVMSNLMEKDVYCGDLLKQQFNDNISDKCLKNLTSFENSRGLNLFTMKYLQLLGGKFKSKTINRALLNFSGADIPENHKLKISNWLLDQGADINSLDHPSKTPISNVISRNNFLLANLFFDIKPPKDSFRDLLFLKLIKKFSKSEIEDYTSFELYNLYSLINKFLAADVNINITLPDGMTPLMLASKYANEYLTKTLLDAGAKADELHKIKGWEDEQSAISLAANYYSFNLEPIFLSYGYDVGQKFNVTRNIKAKQDKEKEIKIAQEAKEEKARLVKAKKTAMTHPFLATVSCNFNYIIGCLGSQGSINYKSHSSVVSLSKNDFYRDSEFKVPLSKSFVFKVQNGGKRHAEITLTITDIITNKIVYSDSTTEAYGILSVKN